MMAMRTTLVCAALAAVLSACETEQKASELRGTAAMRSGEAIRNASIERAIVSQRTLYPFHFVTGSAELNELGRRDLGVLARHLSSAGGEIVLSQGDADDALQGARGKRVVAVLQELGVPKDRAKLGDGLPGGDGISGARLVKILAGPSGSLGDAPTVGGGSGRGGVSAGGGLQ